VSFDEKVVIPRDQIRLPVQASLEVVEVDFIVVDTFSPLHSHCGQTLAPYPRGYFFNFALKCEIFVRGLD